MHWNFQFEIRIYKIYRFIFFFIANLFFFDPIYKIYELIYKNSIGCQKDVKNVSG